MNTTTVTVIIAASILLIAVAKYYAIRIRRFFNGLNLLIKAKTDHQILINKEIMERIKLLEKEQVKITLENLNLHNLSHVKKEGGQ